MPLYRGTRYPIAGTGVLNTAVPLSITNLVAWYKADAGVTGDSEVTQWADQSGNGHHLALNSAQNGPDVDSTTQNGLPVLNFTSSNTEWMNNTSLGASYTDWSFVGVVNPDSDTGIIVGSDVAASDKRWDWRLSGNNRRLKVLANSSQFIQGATAFSSGWYDVAVTLDGTNSEGNSWLEGVSEGTLSGTMNPLEHIRVGEFWSPPIPYDGKIAELIFYGKVLSATERGKLRTYLVDKWGL